MAKISDHSNHRYVKGMSVEEITNLYLNHKVIKEYFTYALKGITEYARLYINKCTGMIFMHYEKSSNNRIINENIIQICDATEFNASNALEDNYNDWYNRYFVDRLIVARDSI